MMHWPITNYWRAWGFLIPTKWLGRIRLTTDTDTFPRVDDELPEIGPWWAY
jgi:hypothetical protein